MSLDSTEAQWKDVWNIYDLDKDGKISKTDFISAVRVLGRRYTAAQMEEKMKAFGDNVHWDNYYGFLCDPYTGPSPDDLLNALKAFDGKDSGELSISQVMSLLTTMGDKIPIDEAKAICEGIPQTNGKVSIEDLLKYLNPPVPSSTPNIQELMRQLMDEAVQKAKSSAEAKNFLSMGDNTTPEIGQPVESDASSQSTPRPSS